MSLVEIFEAITGFYELENERNENYLDGVRRIAYWSAVGSHLDMKKTRLRNHEDILKLKRDVARMKERLKDMLPVTMEVRHK
jgi:hypothetical protein